MPHEVVPGFVEEYDELAAYEFDSAVNFFGITIENALQERDEVGTGKNARYEPRYTLDKLLDPAFRLPRPIAQNSQSIGAQLMAMVGRIQRGRPRRAPKPGTELRPQ